MSGPPRTLAFVSLDRTNERDAGQNSHYLFAALTRQWHGRSVAIDELRIRGVHRQVLGVRKLFHRVLLNAEEPVFASSSALRHYTSAIRLSLLQLQPDVVVTSQPFLLCDSSAAPGAPVLLHNDATVRGLERIGGYLDRWGQGSIDRLALAETRAVRNARRLTVTSRWAAQDYVDNYGVAADRVQVLPIGANIDDENWRLTSDEKSRPRGTDILFFGGDWDRKGGDIACRVVEQLRQEGYPARLVVVGPSTNPAPAMRSVRYVGRLDKASQQSVRDVRAAALSCAFLLLPTRSDCSPAVVAEVAALGLPTLASDVGGLTDTVLSGVTGRCLRIDASLREWCRAAVEMLRDAATGDVLGHAALKRYEDAMNWDAIARVMLAELQPDETTTNLSGGPIGTA